MAAAPDVSRDAVESLVGRSVGDLSLYRRALTHRSLLRGDPDQHVRSNERLEFLGDALIDLVVSEALYERFPNEDEGHLTRLRAKLVSGPALARYARRMDLGPHLLMSENAEREEGRDNPNILADAFEALAGALYLDQDYGAAAQFVHRRALDPFDLTNVAARDENYKSQLLERMQAEGRPQPTYRVVREEGPSHDKTFTVEAVVGDTAYAQGTAGSKQRAEQQAARRTLEALSAAESAG
jgi:ribonuclease-3